MSKAAKAVSYDHVTPQLLKAVEAVIDEAKQHRYSVSRVYAAHNAAFKQNHQPQTCSSCLRNRVRELTAWYKDAPKDPEPVVLEEDDEPDTIYGKLVKRLGLAIGETPAEELAVLGKLRPIDLTPDEVEAVNHRVANLGGFPEGLYDEDPNAPGLEAPVPGVIRYPMGEDVLPFDFTPNAQDPNKGTVVYVDGSAVKAGTYETADGTVIAVQPGGRATIKAIEEDLT